LGASAARPDEEADMSQKLQFNIEGDRLGVKGLPTYLRLRGMGYTSKTLAELKYLSIASANIMAAKFYIDTVKKMTSETDPHIMDAVLLAAIVKYASVFKPDSRGKWIDSAKIFKSKIRIVNKAMSDKPMLIDDPELDTWKSHQRLIQIRDQVIAHDDRIFGNTECFAALDDKFNCERVIVVTQRTSVYSAIKPELDRLPMCIDAVFTWLADEKERYCQLAADEINKLKLQVREKFPEPKFDSYRGLSNAADRQAQKEPYWEFDWGIGEKKLVQQIEEIRNDPK
jgi:hypothetical protein